LTGMITMHPARSTHQTCYSSRKSKALQTRHA